jgi:hypothetical protein
VVSFLPRPLYPQGKSPWYPLDRRLGGPQSCSRRGGCIIICSILILSMLCVEFHLARMQTKFYRNYPHNKKDWAGLLYIVLEKEWILWNKWLKIPLCRGVGSIAVNSLRDVMQVASHPVEVRFPGTVWNSSRVWGRACSCAQITSPASCYSGKAFVSFFPSLIFKWNWAACPSFSYSEERWDILLASQSRVRDFRGRLQFTIRIFII